jgi:hypothetical protein
MAFFVIFCLFAQFCCSASHANAQSKYNWTTVDYLLNKILSKIDLWGPPPYHGVHRHRPPLAPPNLQVKAAGIEAEVEEVNDGNGNRGGGGGDSNSGSGGGQKHWGQATINYKQQRNGKDSCGSGDGGNGSGKSGNGSGRQQRNRGAGRKRCHPATTAMVVSSPCHHHRSRCYRVHKKNAIFSNRPWTISE